MPNAIFGNEAPKYWARDLPVIPLKGKVPVHNGWQGYLGAIPNEEKQRELVAAHTDNNIGLLQGVLLEGDKVLVALDIDDDRLLKVSLQLLGLNRAERRAALSGKRGKKGMTIFVGAPKSLKSTVIKGAGGLGNIDFLATGRMTVMPPSIHPETGRPYEVVGKPLLEVDMSELPEITEHHVKLLKATIGSEHVIALIEGKATHDAGLALVAILVRAGATDEEITDIIEGLLPDGYSGDSLKELPEWIKSAREKGFAETDEDDEETQSAKLVRLALGQGILLFRDVANKDVAMVALPHTGPSIVYRVTSGTVKLWLRSAAYKQWGKPVSSHPLNEAIGTLEAIALFDKPALTVSARVAGDGNTVAIDLGTDDGRIVSITKEGWKVETTSAHRFIRGAGFRSLPLPEAVEGGLRRFQTFLGLDDESYRLLLAFLVNSLRPGGPYLILLVEGEQGSGKSFFCEIIKRIIDPNDAMRMRLPDKPQDLMIQAKEYRLLSFDNASGMSGEMSDALCSLSTGGGFAVRKLYTDGDIYVMTYTRPFMINGIGGYANRPDLMERAIPIRLPSISEGGRKTEEELLAEFEQMLPGVLGELYDAVAHALREYGEIEPPRHLRMADAARWISAAEAGLGEKPGAIIEAIANAQNEFVMDRANDDPLVLALRKVVSPVGFQGYVGELHDKMLENLDSQHHRNLPKTPSHLSNQLIRMRPAMAKAGIKVEFVGKDRKGRKVSIRFVEPDEKSEPK